MAFVTGKEEKVEAEIVGSVSGQAQEVVELDITETIRETRYPRKSESRHNEPRMESRRPLEEPRRPQFNRNRSVSLKATVGRPAAFHKIYVEEIREEGSCSDLILPNRSMDGMNVGSSHNLLLYVSRINGAVYWHAIVIETLENPVKGTAVKSHMYRETEDGTEIFNYWSTYDSTVDEVFRQRVEAYLSEEVPSAGGYIGTNTTIIPTEVDLDDPEIIRTIVYLADDANITIANAESPYVIAPGSKTSIRGNTRFNQERIKTGRLGQPYRADFTIELSEYDRDSGQDFFWQSSSDRSLVTVDGFVTASYVGPMEYPEDVRDNRQYDPACFVPEIAITNIDTYSMEEGQFDRAVLGLASIPYINSNDYWTREFEQTFGSSDPHRKVSGFAYGMVWLNDVLPAGFEAVDDDVERRSRWISNVFRAGSADVCVMINEGGIDFTLGKLLIDIGNNHQVALQRLLTSANVISNNVFADICESNDIRFTPHDVVSALVRVPTGYFLTNEGIQPIEMVDTLYILNRICQNTPDIITDWYRTTTINTNMAENEALTRLVRAFSFVTGKQFVHKGFITKAYLGGTFLKTIYAAGIESLVVRMECDANANVNRNGRRTIRGDRRDGLQADLAVSRGNVGGDRNLRRRPIATMYR